MVDQIMNMGEGTKIQLLAPVVRGRKGEHAKVLERAKRSGYVRVRIDGSMYELTEEIKLDKNIKHNIDIVVDRLVVKDGIQRRLTDSIENVLELAEGLLVVDVIGGAGDLQPELLLSGLRHQCQRSGAEKLLLQQSLRCLPGMFWTGLQDGV